MKSPKPEPPAADPPGIVTRLERQYRRPTRVDVYVDDEFSLTLSATVIQRTGLGLGDRLTRADRERLLSEEDAARAFARAGRLLAYRPRSEAELRRRFADAGIPAAGADAAIERLKAGGLVDDAAFARYWVENRAAFQPRGERLLSAELRAKGIERDVARDAIEQEEQPPPAEQAYRVAQRYASRLDLADHDDFRRRLGAHLSRRGFDSGTIADVTRRLWREAHGESE